MRYDVAMLDRRWSLVPALVLSACAHKELAGADLDRVARPAFVARIDENAGPQSTVFRSDDSYRTKLKKLEPKEADRRLREKLSIAMTRFEVSDRLRSTTLALLPREAPWTHTANPTAVARALESFLVEEVPANPPDLDLLKPLGVDAVVEFVIEDYGMRSEQGHAGVFVTGYGRMVVLDDGKVIWKRSFRADQLDSGEPPIDPFAAAKEIKQGETKGAIYRSAMENLLDAVAKQFAKDLSPADRRGGPAVSNSPEQSGSDSTNKTGRENELPPGELPPPEQPL
jgi:hypothetical protein